MKTASGLVYALRRKGYSVVAYDENYHVILKHARISLGVGVGHYCDNRFERKRKAFDVRQLAQHTQSVELAVKYATARHWQEPRSYVPVSDAFQLIESIQADFHKRT